MAGMGRESGTRSGLLWEVERLLKECVELNGNLPEVLLMENVPQVHSEGDNMRNFMEWVQFLNSLGYESYWQDMNAKDYGIPQNRNRTFMVSLLGNYTYKFPEAIPLKLRLKDMLEDNVNEKYYLGSYSKSGYTQTQVVGKKGVAPTVTENHGQVTAVVVDNDVDVMDYRYDEGFRNRQKDNGNVLIPALPSTHLGTASLSGQPFVVKKYKEFANENGYVPKMFNPYNKAEIEDTAPAQTGQYGSTTSSNAVLIAQKNLRIRKLTPKECWRLMGFSDEDFEKAAQVNSDCQLYKQAGNSIVTNCLEAIFSQLL